MRITVTRKDLSLAFQAQANTSLLYSGLQQGIALPYECATGTCGTCKARLISGQIDPGWPQAPGRSYLKTERDELLLCQAHALSDCELRLPSALARLPEHTPDFYTAQITDITPLTHDVRHFRLDLNAPMSFQAGQFVVLSVPNVEGFRAYSMLNYAKPSPQLDFVIKRLEGGGFSEWLFGTARSGVELRLFGPLGSATFNPSEQKDLICIAGGSGIAGMMSILRLAAQEQYFRDHQGVLYFGVRTAQDVFFLDELHELADQCGSKLIITLVLSEQTDLDVLKSERSNVQVASGFVHEAALQDLANRSFDASNSLAYIAGPPPMVDAALRGLMQSLGLGPKQIRYDKFS